MEKVIENYNLEEWGDRLESKWIGDEADRASLRKLATEFNQAVLQTALLDEEISITESDVENIYQILTDQGESQTDIIRKRRELERAGVAIDEVLSDFVTHQAIHTYLTQVRNTSFPEENEDRGKKKKRTIQRLSSRTQAVTNTTIQELINSGKISNKDYDIFVNIRAVCNNCGGSYTIGELIDEEGCNCN